MLFQSWYSLFIYRINQDLQKRVDNLFKYDFVMYMLFPSLYSLFIYRIKQDLQKGVDNL